MNNIKEFFIMNNPNEQVIMTQGHMDNIYNIMIIMGTTIIMLLFLVYNLYRIGGLV